MSSDHPSASSENSPPHTPPATAEDFPPDHFIEDPGTDEEHQTLLHRQATILEPSISEQGPASLLPHSTTGHNTLGSPLSDEHEDGESLPEYPEEDFDPGHYDEEDDNYEDMELSASSLGLSSRAQWKHSSTQWRIHPTLQRCTRD